MTISGAFGFLDTLECPVAQPGFLLINRSDPYLRGCIGRMLFIVMTLINYIDYWTRTHFESLVLGVT